MKKKLIIFVLLIPFISTLTAASYSPSAELSLGANFTHFDKSIDRADKYRTVFSIDAGINPLSITLEENRRLSLPVHFEYMAKSSFENRQRLQERYRFSFGLRFDYLFSSSFALFIEPSCGYTYYPLISAGSLFMALTAGPEIFITRFFSISLPVKAIASAKEAEFTMSVALSVYPIGAKKK